MRMYKIVNAAIQNDGSVVERKHHRIIRWPTELSVGGLYVFAGGRLGGPKLYKILEQVE